MFAELRIGDISHPSPSSCGRVIGEPWKSKLNVKGWSYTYRTWRREMSASIEWIKNHSRIQFLVKNSEPPRNFDTGGRRNSQNKRCVNGTKDINRWSFRCTMSQSWSALSDVPHGLRSRCPIGVGWKFILSKGNQTVTGRDDFFRNVETRSQK